MPAPRIMRASSRVVSTASTSRQPSAEAISGRCASYFLAVQGMMDTTKILAGSSPSFRAK
jgi:hypothetical protein